MWETKGKDGAVHGGTGADPCSSHVAPVTGTHRETSAGKGFIRLAPGATGTGLGASRGHLAVPGGGLVALAASAHAQGEALAAVAVEGAVAVVADMVAGARLCLALIYVWKRRGEGQSCAKGTGLVWHGQGRGWRGHGRGGCRAGRSWDTKASPMPAATQLWSCHRLSPRLSGGRCRLAPSTPAQPQSVHPAPYVLGWSGSGL